MQQVEHYLRQAKAARDLASASNSDLVRAQFEKIAQTWEMLAKERLSLLQLKIDRFGAEGLLIVAQTPDTTAKADGTER